MNNRSPDHARECLTRRFDCIPEKLQRSVYRKPYSNCPGRCLFHNICFSDLAHFRPPDKARRSPNMQNRIFEESSEQRVWAGVNVLLSGLTSLPALPSPFDLHIPTGMQQNWRTARSWHSSLVTHTAGCQHPQGLRGSSEEQEVGESMSHKQQKDSNTGKKKTVVFLVSQGKGCRITLTTNATEEKSVNCMTCC